MIQFDEALSVVLRSSVEIPKERRHFTRACGYVLAEDITSDMDMPPFDKSAMDGFACRKQDLGASLKVIETIPAGSAPKQNITPGECSRIMTGGMLPQGADCVIKIEDTSETEDRRIRFVGDYTYHNICYKGEDIKSGQVVLHKGSLLQARHIAVLASVGCTEPLVNRQLSFGIIATGDELVEPGEKPGLSMIRNSNAWQLMSQVQAMNGNTNYYGIVADEETALTDAINKALDENDIVLISGGVSMGDFDYVPPVLKQCGVKILFEKIAVQPGSPTVFGKSGSKYVFGLPGNPVSTYVQFELLVKPLVYSLMGMDFKPLPLRLPMGKAYERKKSTRMTCIPVRIEQGKVFPVDYHGSAHIHAYADAHGIICIPEGNLRMEEGEPADVRLI